MTKIRMAGGALSEVILDAGDLELVTAGAG